MMPSSQPVTQRADSDRDACGFAHDEQRRDGKHRTPLRGDMVDAIRSRDDKVIDESEDSDPANDTVTRLDTPLKPSRSVSDAPDPPDPVSLKRRALPRRSPGYGATVPGGRDSRQSQGWRERCPA